MSKMNMLKKLVPSLRKSRSPPAEKLPASPTASQTQTILAAPASPKILILGASGYIGGTVLVDLLKTHAAADITALVRDEAKAALVAPFGVKTVLGSMEDAAHLGELAAAHDAVLNFAVPFGGGDATIQALVDGLERRARSADIKPVLLQTSGSGSVLYGSDGVAGTDVWRDSDHARWEALPDTAFFHAGDRIVAKAAERAIISAYIVMSPTVYGPGRGPGNKLSLQIPAYVRYAKRTGQAAYVGAGDNIWGNVHVTDLSRLYLLLLDHARADPAATAAAPGSHGWSNLIYAGLAQHSWRPIIELIGDRLYARGDVKQPGAISIPEGAGDMYMFGGNSFMPVSEKAKALGWKQEEPDLVAAIRLALA